MAEGKTAHAVTDFLWFSLEIFPVLLGGSALTFLFSPSLCIFFSFPSLPTTPSPGDVAVPPSPSPSGKDRPFQAASLRTVD